MTMTDGFNILIAGVGVLTTLTLGWIGLTVHRAARRGDHARTALAVAREMRELADASPPTTAPAAAQQELLLARAEDAARFSVSEYARVLLRDGWSGVWIAVLMVYGTPLGVIGAVRMATVDRVGDPTAWTAPVIFAVGVAVFLVGYGALLRKMDRRKRMRQAGLDRASGPEVVQAVVDELRLQREAWARRGLRRRGTARRAGG